MVPLYLGPSAGSALFIIVCSGDDVTGSNYPIVPPVVVAPPPVDLAIPVTFTRDRRRRRVQPRRAAPHLRFGKRAIAAWQPRA